MAYLGYSQRGSGIYFPFFLLFFLSSYLCLFSPFYARKQLLLSARLSHRNSVHPSVRLSVHLSVTQADQAKTVQARISIFHHQLPGRL